MRVYILTGPDYYDDHQCVLAVYATMAFAVRGKARHHRRHTPDKRFKIEFYDVIENGDYPR